MQLVNSLSVRDHGSISSIVDTRLYGQGSCSWNKINDRRHARSHSLIPPNLFASINLFFFLPSHLFQPRRDFDRNARSVFLFEWFYWSVWIDTHTRVTSLLFFLIPLFLSSIIIVRSARNAVGWKQQGCRRIESTRDRSTLRK